MPAKLPPEHQLLFCEFKSLADRSGRVDAGEIEDLHELVAGLIKDLILITHADDVGRSGLKEYSSS